MSNSILTDQFVNQCNDTNLSMESSQWMTIRQFCVAFPWPSESAMRAYIYRAEQLGISEAFIRVGRRVLVMPKNFFLLIKKVESR